MAYTAGIMNKRVKVYNRGTSSETAYGRTEGIYALAATVWAAVDWTRGTKAMRQGAVEAYDTIMVRTRYTANITRDSLFGWDSRAWIITSIYRDYQKNTIQITAVESVNGSLPPDPTPPTPTPDPDDEDDTQPEQELEQDQEPEDIDSIDGE